jgi:soluble lytic murein transglycosylase-like protein
MAPLLNKSLSGFAFALSAVVLLLIGTHVAHAPAQTALEACSPEVQNDAAASADPEIHVAPEQDAAQQALASYLARRFTIAAEAAGRIVAAAWRAGEDSGLDPLLLLAMISVESRFNPFAESALGAKGLMQIIPKYHQDKLEALGGEAVVLDPETNIRLGAQILQEYVLRAGTLEAALQFYNGAASDPSAQYAQKILAERTRLEAAAYPEFRHAALTFNNTKGS